MFRGAEGGNIKFISVLDIFLINKVEGLKNARK